MSNAEPPPNRLPPAAVALIVLLPVLLVLALAAPLGAAWAWGRRHQPAASESSRYDPNATDGSRGVGDPYYPNAGNGGYDVARYQIGVSWDPGTSVLTGHTTVTARATHPLHSFYLDLALDISRITVDGQVAGLAKEGFSDWRITPAAPVAGGADFTVVVDYAGRPGKLRSEGASPWRSSGEEWTVAGEPESSAWWYPANDHPSDPALMDISVRVPAGLQAVSVGRLESRDSADERDWDTWHWVSRQPMATYLAFVSIGHFALEQGVVDGLPYVYAVTERLTADERRTAFAVLQTSAAKVRVLSTLFGPYPFTELGGIAVAADLPFDGLEAQARPVYKARSVLDPRYSGQLVTHELAHMWFGDHVTVAQWNDIFDSEAYASWAFWAWQEKTGGPSAQSELTRLYDRFAGDEDFWRVTMTDPGRADLFTTVYLRGPMALQALRNVMGDAAFARLNTEWAQDPGSRSLEQWMAKAQSLTPVDLGPFFQAWLAAPTAPARTAANGLG